MEKYDLGRKDWHVQCHVAPNQLANSRGLADMTPDLFAEYRDAGTWYCGRLYAAHDFAGAICIFPNGSSAVILRLEADDVTTDRLRAMLRAVPDDIDIRVRRELLDRCINQARRGLL